MLMLVIRDKANIKIDYPVSTIANPDKTIFFDIETTGFSRKYCNVYLIGCMYFSNNELMYAQWLAENFNDEANVLMAFHKFLKRFNTIIHFNGNAFDIPFVKERGEKYNLDFDFDRFNSIDIYKPLSKLNHILNLENQKQKTFEKALNIKRTDPFSGGELVEVFKHYVESKDERLIFPLLLHNREDVINMGKLISLLSVKDVFDGKFHIQEYSINEYTNVEGDIEKELRINISFENRIPLKMIYNKDYLHFSAIDDRGYITVKIINGTFKYFFPNSKDYYYLPLEDKAIHKSIASFVDKNYRKQASASTCYEKFSGEFLPVYSLDNDCFPQVLREDYKSKTGVIKPSVLKDENIYSYVLDIIKFMKNK